MDPSAEMGKNAKGGLTPRDRGGEKLPTSKLRIIFRGNMSLEKERG